MPASANTSQIKSDLLSTMSAGECSDEAFNTLAIRVFEYQFSSNTPYRNYCKQLSKSLEEVSHWSEIPLVSTDAFKVPRHPLSTVPAAEAQNVFLTSGTTSEIKGRHLFPSLDLYEASILAMWQRLALPQPATVVFLTPHPEDAPNSSLSHMMGVLADYFGGAEIIWAIEKNGRMDFDKLTSLADRAEPIAILGTAIAFLHLFENISLPLPNGSFAMETGGYKGTRRRLEKTELYALFEEKLALQSSAIINEYSMTELSSQFYTRGLGLPHTSPPWVKTRIIDPRTGTNAAAGEPGHLAIYDLANLYSVMALQTQDIAIAGENGSFTLLGRDPTALPRGCSRAADDTLR